MWMTFRLLCSQYCLYTPFMLYYCVLFCAFKKCKTDRKNDIITRTLHSQISSTHPLYMSLKRNRVRSVRLKQCQQWCRKASSIVMQDKNNIHKLLHFPYKISFFKVIYIDYFSKNLRAERAKNNSLVILTKYDMDTCQIKSKLHRSGYTWQGCTYVVMTFIRFSALSVIAKVMYITYSIILRLCLLYVINQLCSHCMTVTAMWTQTRHLHVKDIVYMHVINAQSLNIHCMQATCPYPILSTSCGVYTRIGPKIIRNFLPNQST